MPTKRAAGTTKHLLLPDVQAKPGVPLDHIDWVAKYAREKRPDTIICIGDFYDLPSLSSYDKGKKSFEGRTYRADVDVGNEALERLTHIATKGLRNKPRLVFTLGNHEQRIERAVENQRELEGQMGYHDLAIEHLGWEMFPFLKPVEIDGITYCHFFPIGPRGTVTQTHRGAPSAEAQLQRMGRSCTAGHQQGLSVANRPFGGKMQWGIIAGSCYQHDESYLSPQGNTHWRGVVVKHEVRDGSYNPMFVSLDFLKRQYGWSRPSS